MIDSDVFEKFVQEAGREDAIFILELFSNELDEYVKKLESNSSFQNIKDITHQIKSSAKSLGALKLSEDAISVELAAKNEDEAIKYKLKEFILLIEHTKKSVSERILDI